jgi:hypothetical protein
MKKGVKKMKKEIRDRVSRQCTSCGKDMTVILYTDKSYRGGHYWGKIGIYSKKEMEKELKSSYKEVKIGNTIARVHDYEPKTTKYFEDWECPKCYWGR